MERRGRAGKPVVCRRGPGWPVYTACDWKRGYVMCGHSVSGPLRGSWPGGKLTDAWGRDGRCDLLEFWAGRYCLFVLWCFLLFLFLSFLDK